MKTPRIIGRFAKSSRVKCSTSHAYHFCWPGEQGCSSWPARTLPAKLNLEIAIQHIGSSVEAKNADQTSALHLKGSSRTNMTISGNFICILVIAENDASHT